MHSLWLRITVTQGQLYSAGIKYSYSRLLGNIFPAALYALYNIMEWKNVSF